jgi:transcriptional regulator with PAS, ATPase and Fis domain
MNTDQTITMIRTLHAQGLSDEAAKLEERLRQHNPSVAIPSAKTEEELAKFITVHPKMMELKDTIRKLSIVDDPVMIRGETGTGKEILAKALHGSRSGKFESINCAAIPEQLLESILFGHVKGSFTGADSDKVGLMQVCYNGTLHLDEVGEMPLPLQGKLLRALQEKKIRRIGDNKEIDINCRIVASTNRDIQNPTIFRVDLYWRLCVFEVFTLPLRDRLDDIPLIIKAIAKNNPVPDDLLKFDLEVLKNPNVLIKGELTETSLALARHTREDIYVGFLLGNVRQLQGIVRRYQVLGTI